MDSLDEALAALRLERAAFARIEMAAATGDHVRAFPAEDGDGQLACYQVLSGACMLEAPGSPDRMLAAGTFVLVKRDAAHRLRAVGRSGACSLVAGQLQVDASSSLRLLEWLPPHALIAASSRLQALQAAILALLARAEPGSPSGEAVLRRMAEALLVQAIDLLADREPELRRRCCATGDTIVQRCLALMYRRPEAPWTLPLLAREVHTSRTVLAERFTAAVGEPPISHLTRWRLAAAARLLRQTPWSLGRIAEAVGYQSEPAFCRAFRRQFGLPPAAWRRQQACAPVQEELVAAAA